MDSQERYEIRNIKEYYTPRLPSIREVAAENPEFRAYVDYLSQGKIDLYSPEALAEFNRSLFKMRYGLDLQFHPRAIIPTPGLRELFLTRIIEPFSHMECPQLLEIGTGASAVMALMVARMFSCSIQATEVEEEYSKWAEENICRNGYSDAIPLIKSAGGILRGVIPPEKKFDLIFSNPPYYDTPYTGKTGWQGQTVDLIGAGNAGEKFILTLLEESVDFLYPNGRVAFIIPVNRHNLLRVADEWLQNCSWDYHIECLVAGNRKRYLFIAVPPIIE